MKVRFGVVSYLVCCAEAVHSNIRMPDVLPLERGWSECLQGQYHFNFYRRALLRLTTTSRANFPSLPPSMATTPDTTLIAALHLHMSTLSSTKPSQRLSWIFRYRSTRMSSGTLRTSAHRRLCHGLACIARWCSTRRRRVRLILDPQRRIAEF